MVVLDIVNRVHPFAIPNFPKKRLLGIVRELLMNPDCVMTHLKTIKYEEMCGLLNNGKNSEPTWYEVNGRVWVSNPRD